MLALSIHRPRVHRNDCVEERNPERRNAGKLQKGVARRRPAMMRHKHGPDKHRREARRCPSRGNPSRRREGPVTSKGIAAGVVAKLNQRDELGKGTPAFGRFAWGVRGSRRLENLVFTRPVPSGAGSRARPVATTGSGQDLRLVLIPARAGRRATGCQSWPRGQRRYWADSSRRRS
jgi:hypothetical protein